MPEKEDAVLKLVLNKIKPKPYERRKIEALTIKLQKKVSAAAGQAGLRAKVRVEGSVAKDTWISQEPDIDVFMQLPRTVPRQSLGEVGLKVARKATEGSEQVERFAEHPYLEAFVDGTRVNIVPCYSAKPGNWLSATDRTPFHTDYMNKQLTGRKRDHVRLLKKFMKGTGVYGAEIKTGGFSGYLCELLILHFGSFTNVLQTFAQAKPRLVIDIEGSYARRANELELLFSEPLVIVDPVDKARNVASSVLPQKLQEFEAASREFLKRPNVDFFYPPPTIAITPSVLRGNLAQRGSTLVFVAFGKVEAVPDVLWGQLYKTQRSLRKMLQINNFETLRDVAWSDEETLNMFVFDVGQRRLSGIRKHLGPPLDHTRECDSFLAKHTNGKETISGPYLEAGRWMVLLRRKYTDVVQLLKDKLSGGGRNAGVAEAISLVIREDFKVLVNDEIIGIYEENGPFAEFLTEFLKGKHRWLSVETERD